ncbi:hypothetical protein QUB68_08280 [Microcoleus sp. A006_D1]|uniref:hypothetical protein n=1 Tax=Microcoleus sp. A006_D1 TaxID=3055267 RepID=UPI002FD07E68
MPNPQLSKNSSHSIAANYPIYDDDAEYHGYYNYSCLSQQGSYRQLAAAIALVPATVTTLCLFGRLLLLEKVRHLRQLSLLREPVNQN